MKKTFRVYGAEGHRQKISFGTSKVWDFSDGLSTRVIEIRNCDLTGTNDYTELVVECGTEKECYAELFGQVSDGLFENARTGKITEIVDGVEIEINGKDYDDEEDDDDDFFRSIIDNPEIDNPETVFCVNFAEIEISHDESKKRLEEYIAWMTNKEFLSEAVNVASCFEEPVSTEFSNLIDAKKDAEHWVSYGNNIDQDQFFFRYITRVAEIFAVCGDEDDRELKRVCYYVCGRDGKAVRVK